MREDALGWWRKEEKSFEGIFLPEKTFPPFAKACQVCQKMFHLPGKGPISRQVCMRNSPPDRVYADGGGKK